MIRALLIPGAFLLMSCDHDQKTGTTAETQPSKTPSVAPMVSAKESSADSFIGLTTQDAMNKAKAENRRARIAEEDGEARMLTRDFIPNRLNFFIKNGRVIRVTLG